MLNEKKYWKCVKNEVILENVLGTNWFLLFKRIVIKTNGRQLNTCQYHYLCIGDLGKWIYIMLKAEHFKKWNALILHHIYCSKDEMFSVPFY